MVDFKASDLAAKNGSLFAIWIVPMALLFALNFTTNLFSPHTQVGIAAALLAWMGAACTLNAVRCLRLHSMIAGPILLIGAALLASIPLGIAHFGNDGPTYIIWATLGFVALSFVPEKMFGKYLETKS